MKPVLRRRPGRRWRPLRVLTVAAAASVAALLFVPAVASAVAGNAPAAAGAAVGSPAPDEQSPDPQISDGRDHKFPVLKLKPPFDKNPVKTDHTVTATLTRDSKPIKGATILFFVTGANTASGKATTDDKGMAEFTYTGENTGTDKILACWDINRNKKCDKFEPFDTAKKVWVKKSPSPSPSPSQTKTSRSASALPVTGASTTSLASGGLVITLLGVALLLALVVVGRWRRRREAGE